MSYLLSSRTSTHLLRLFYRHHLRWILNVCWSDCITRMTKYEVYVLQNEPTRVEDSATKRFYCSVDDQQKGATRQRLNTPLKKKNL